MKQIFFIAILFLFPLTIKTQSDTLLLGNLVQNHYQHKIDSIVMEMIILWRWREEPGNIDKFDSLLGVVMLLEIDANSLLERIKCRRRVDSMNWFKKNL